MSTEPTPACERHLRHDTFREATEGDLMHREPCGYCFPEGEIDVDEENLLVACRNSSSIHRRESTGPVDYESTGTPEEGTIASKLADEGVTDFDDLDLGGEA